MFWIPFVFRGHTTREPASVACIDEQGDLFFSVGPHRILRQPHLTQGKKWRDRLEKKLKGPGKQKLERKKYGAVGGPCITIF